MTKVVSAVSPVEFGAVPRARLLPPEVLQREKDKRSRRSAIGFVLLAIVISIVATAAATLYSLTAQATLAAAQARTATLLAQQDEFAEVRGVAAALQSAKAARIAAVSTEVDWKSWNQSVIDLLPAGSAVVSMVINAGTPAEPYPAPSVPLQGERIAAATYEVATTTIGGVAAWLLALESVEGYVDAEPTIVALDSTTGLYVSTVIIHVDASVFTLRFDETE
jgi:hypothetical protein